MRFYHSTTAAPGDGGKDANWKSADSGFAQSAVLMSQESLASHSGHRDSLWGDNLKAGTDNAGQASSSVRDYCTLLKTMSPAYCGDALSPTRCLGLLPIATGMHLCSVTMFMIVEVSGGGGGTSGVAGTRAVMLFFAHFLLLGMAIMISRAGTGNLANSNAVRQRRCTLQSARSLFLMNGTLCPAL